MQRARLAAAAAVMVLAAVTTAGCGSGDDAPKRTPAPPVGPNATPLVEMLNQIRATDASRAWTTFGDLAAQRALGGGTIPQQLQGMASYGWATTWERGPEAKAQLGLAGDTADRAAEVGESHGAGRFDGGVDTAAVVAHAKKLGAAKDGALGPLTLWRLAPDNADHLSREMAQLSRGTADFDVLAVGPHTVVRAASRAQAKVLSANGGKDTLARDQDFRGVAECLGKPLAATFSNVRIEPASDVREAAGFVAGAGVVGTSPTKLTQTACRTASSTDEAEQVAAALRKELAHGSTRLSRLPWKTMLSDVQVKVVGGPAHVVRVTGTSEKSPQLVLEMLRGGDLSDLLDTSHSD